MFWGELIGHKHIKTHFFHTSVALWVGIFYWLLPSFRKTCLVLSCCAVNPDILLWKKSVWSKLMPLHIRAWDMDLFCWFVCHDNDQYWHEGYLYSILRGEILGFMEDELLWKYLPRMSWLIKNKRWGIKDFYNYNLFSVLCSSFCARTWHPLWAPWRTSIRKCILNRWGIKDD